MKNEHILDILDEKVFAELRETDLQAIKTHAAKCEPCAQAFSAARISSLLLRAETVEEFAPSPFFQTRVMANLRERQAKMNPFAALARIWRASAALVMMMMAIVIALIALTVFAPSSVSAGAPNFDADSDEMVIINERITTREPTNEQVFQLIYGTSEGAAKK